MRTQAIRLALALVLLRPFAPAQWVHTESPYGGEVSRIAAFGTTLLAWADDVGLMRSTNKGKTWEPSTMLGNESTGFRVLCFAASGKNIFAGSIVFSPQSGEGSGGGVFRSTDNGVVWTSVNNGLPDGFIDFLAAGPARNGGTNLYASSKNGFYRSTNDGADWEAVRPARGDTAVRGLAVIPNCLGGPRVFVSYASSEEGGVFVSTDDGTHWALADTGLPGHYVNCFAATSDGAGRAIIFAGTFSGVYRSTDNGKLWKYASGGLSSNSLNVNSLIVDSGAHGNKVLLAATTRGVSASTDNGVSWTNSSTGLMDSYVHALAMINEGACRTTLFIGTLGAGVLRSTDHGASWTLANTGIEGTYLSCMAATRNALFAGTWGSGLFRSTNHGMTWTVAGENLRGTDIGGLSVLGANVFANAQRGIFRSSQHGTCWVKADSGLPKTFDEFGYSVSALAEHDGKIFAGTTDHGTLWANAHGVFVSNNEGRSWVSSGMGIKSVWGLAVSDTSIFAAVNPTVYEPGRIFRSTDNGKSWFMRIGSFPGWGSCLWTSGTTLGHTRYLFASTSSGLFRSSDDGSSWIALHSGLPQWADSYHLVEAGDNLFLGASTGGVFQSTNHGDSWTPVNAGLTDSWVRALVLSGTDLIAVSGRRGIWRRPLSELITSVESPSVRLPAVFELQQNYPNPFNPNTTITYELPRLSQVTLTVYDMLGREVTVLVNEARDAGIHEVKFDGSSLASGVYLYRLTAGDFVQAKKLVIVK